MFSLCFSLVRKKCEVEFGVHHGTLDEEFISSLLSLYWDTVLVQNFGHFSSLKSTTGQSLCLFGSPSCVHVKEAEKAFLFGRIHRGKKEKRVDEYR